MNELDDIILKITHFIESEKQVKLITSDVNLGLVFIRDVFIKNGMVKLQYEFENGLHEIDLTRLKLIDDTSIYDLLGINENSLDQFVSEKKTDLIPEIKNRYTVQSLIEYLKDKIDGDDSLKNIYIQGEMINVSYSSQGHLYFSLKEKDMSIRCVFFNVNNTHIEHFENGELVELFGNIQIYIKMGIFQIVVDKMGLIGSGSLYGKYESLKKKLEQEGKFFENKKKDIPKYPNKIGIITSREGAAIEDILKVFSSVNICFDVVIYSCLVQGNGAISDIIDKIRLANDLKDVDVLILTRGGGSIEDLWVFNEEEVVESVYHSELPIMTAIGHEINKTLCDEVSDYYFPTPTAAAYFFVNNYSALLDQLSNFHYRLLYLWEREVYLIDEYIKTMKTKLLISSDSQLEKINEHLKILKLKLKHHMPDTILNLGYAMVLSENKKIVKSAKECFNISRDLKLKFHDGEVNVQLKRNGEVDG